MPACGPALDSTSRCFSARPYCPAKHNSSNRKVRRWASVGLSRTSAPSASIAASSFPSLNSWRALMRREPPSLGGDRLEIPAGHHGGALRAVRLLRRVRHVHLPERERQRLGGRVVSAARAGPLDGIDEHLRELVLQVFDRLLPARLEERHRALLEVRSLTAVLAEDG